MRNAIRHIILLLLIITAGNSTFAQYLKNEEGRVDQVVVQNVNVYTVVRPLETMSQSMLLYNSSKQIIRLNVKLRPNRYFKALANFQDQININPYDSVALKIRLINSNAKVNGIYTLFFDLINKDDSTDISTVEYKVEVIDGIDQQFSVQPLQENIFIYQQSKEISVPVLFKNMLPDAEFVTLHLIDKNLPFKMGPAFENGFILPPKDTIITVKLLQMNQLRQLVTQYSNITVVLKNDKGDIVSTFNLNPNFVLSKGAINNDDAAEGSGRSFVESSYYMFGKTRSGFDARIFKPFLHEEDKTSFAINYQQFTGSNGILNNTFFSLRSENLAITAGSQNEIHEMALFGRGLKANLNLNEDKTTKLELWGVDQQFNLLQPITNDGTRIVSSRISADLNEKSDLQLSSSIFQRNAIKSNGHLHFIEYHNRLNEWSGISAKLAGSIEKLNRETGDSSLPGWAGMIRYEFTKDKFSFFGDVYRASRDYAGIMQGSTIVLAGISHALPGNFSISAGVQKNTTDRPNYSPGNFIGKTFYNYTTYDLTFGKSSSIGQFYVKPYLQEQGQQLLFNNSGQGIPQSKSMRLLGGYNGKINMININVQADYGQSSFKNIAAASKAQSLRSTISLNYNNLSINTVYQKGIFFINDLISSLKDPSTHQSIFINGQYNFSYRSLSSQTSINLFHYNSFIGLNTGLYQSLSYRFGNGITANAQGFVNLSGNRMNTQFRIGARKELNLGSENKRVSLSIRVYEDKNGNKVRDNDEQLSRGITIKIDEILMITDDKGRVQLSGLKTGWHTIRILYSSGIQQNLHNNDIDLDKNEKIEIGIPPQHIVKGSVKQVVGRFDEKVHSLEGIKISFRNGNKDLVTYTDANGDFYMQLPPGTYVVAIDRLKNSGDQNAAKQVIVDPAKGCKELIALEFRSFSRQVDIKKF